MFIFLKWKQEDPSYIQSHFYLANVHGEKCNNKSQSSLIIIRKTVNKNYINTNNNFTRVI